MKWSLLVCFMDLYIILSVKSFLGFLDSTSHRSPINVQTYWLFLYHTTNESTMLKLAEGTYGVELNKIKPVGLFCGS